MFLTNGRTYRLMLRRMSKATALSSDLHRTQRPFSQLANAFVAAGIEKGERVGSLMNSSEFMESYYALAKIGAVVVPLNWRL